MRVILSLAIASLVAACAPAPSASDGAVTAVASFYPLAEAVRRVAGDAVEVIELTPPGAEPHDVELTPDDIEAIATADVVLYAGGGFQPAVEDALGEATGVVVDITAELVDLPPPDDHHEAGDHVGADEAGDHEETDAGEHDDELEADPHVWLDPTRYAEMVERVADALNDAAPGTASSDAVRSFRSELASLDEAFRSGLATCDTRLLVVSHAAFGYLADAYGLEQEAISGVSPEAEPDPQRLAELRELVTAEGVTTIFVESLVSPAVGETLASEAGVRTDVLDPLEGLTAERLDAGEDYLSVMRANLEALRDGLGCD
ncbi:MAG TPA: metal ABC transporter substrate-binding protein [Actinomycetota bacterium]|nr:metal ABC transporter substrate-binding protein [Actinomycetota bacterium]